MHSDIDRLMAEYNLDSIVILGDKAPNPYRDYLTRRSKAVGHLFKKRGEAPVFVIQSAMERGEAAHSGLQVYTQFDFGEHDLVQKYNGPGPEVKRDLFCAMLRRFEITGRVAFFGVADVSSTLQMLLPIHDCIPNLEIVLESAANDLFMRAYTTKDEYELKELKAAGKLTSQVVLDTWDFIASHREQNGQVVDSEGNGLTIGHVKAFIRRREAELGLDDPDGCIFAQGRDAGIPHSQGEDSETLQVGKSIVFDIFPRMMESGYFHDMTRTWCIGHAPDDLQRLYDQVKQAFDVVRESVKAGDQTAKYQDMVCDIFEEHGHATPRTLPGTQEGYVHSLGHGVGLNVHESPAFRAAGTDHLQAGNVFTIEPGLYYPEKGYGVRIEDTVYLDSSGTLHDLTDVPYDLVIPLKK
ncbi:MAG TPA: M24 family metallopeptidase [Aggregatilineales bacterium]|nr:M24 family metallopeptidase [Aggregatilineales bacterium]